MQQKAKPTEQELADIRSGQIKDLRDFNLQYVNLNNAIMNGCNLGDVVLVNASLLDANLENAILYKAKLQSAVLTGANLAGSNLQNTRWEGATVKGANFTGADLTGANISPEQLLTAGSLFNTLLPERILSTNPEETFPALRKKIVLDYINGLSPSGQSQGMTAVALGLLIKEDHFRDPITWGENPLGDFQKSYDEKLNYLQSPATLAGMKEEIAKIVGQRDEKVSYAYKRVHGEGETSVWWKGIFQHDVRKTQIQQLANLIDESKPVDAATFFDEIYKIKRAIEAETGNKVPSQLLKDINDMLAQDYGQPTERIELTQ